jgi:hypothetical protein
MKWIDFQVIADEQGLKSEDEIDAIEMIGDRFDVAYTTPDGYAGVIEIKDEE